MGHWYDPIMLVLFAAHLIPMLIIGIRRRELYYLAPITTFALLTLTFALRVFAPEFEVNGRPLHEPVRYAAWTAAGISIPLLVLRIRKRRRERTQD
jgi:dolichyl-phosphate-mannose--protein O-mannosyl transferase